MANTTSEANWELKDDKVVCLSGSWRLFLDAEARERLTRELDELDAPRSYRWNLEGVQALDSTGARVLWDTWGQQLPDDLKGHEQHRHWFDWLAETTFSEPPPRHRIDEAITRTLDAVAGFTRTIGGVLLLIGQLMVDIVYCIQHPRVIPWRETLATIYHVGATSMLLVGSVGFLIGIVMTIQIGMALQQFGAARMVIGMMGLSVLRELGPVICGIILAGRSGSAMTSGIGAMHLTGEYDALRAFGSSPSLRLALPRVIGAAISLPLLVVWSDLTALIGGALTAQLDLGVGYRLFLAQLPHQVQIVNFWLGLAKGVLFGLTIAIIGCYFGMRSTPNAANLSRNTTLSVVTSLTLILVFDASSGALLTNVGLL